MSGVIPQGCQVYSFKSPSAEDLNHDYRWRCMKCLPERGRIGIFNRSYYEETRLAGRLALPITDHKVISGWGEAPAGRPRPSELLAKQRSPHQLIPRTFGRNATMTSGSSSAT